MTEYVKTNNKTVVRELQKIGLKYHKSKNNYYYFVKDKNVTIPAPLNVLDGNDIKS